MRSIQLICTSVILSVFLVACGGGGTLETGGGGGGTGGTEPQYQLELVLVNADNVETSSLSEQQPLTARATLTATQNAVVSGKVIRFSIDQPGLAILSTGTGSVLTDASGVATINLTAGDVSGAGELTAEFIEGENVRATIVAGFQSAGDGGGDISVGSLTLLPSKLKLGSGDNDKVELYAIVKDSSNRLIEGVDVDFSTSPSGAAGGELKLITRTTGSDGIAVAEIQSRIDPTIRSIEVVATAGLRTSSVVIDVVGTSVSVSAPSSMVVADTRQISLLLKDDSDRPIANQALQLSSALGNTFSNPSPVTDSVGRATINYTATNSGNDSINITGLGITQQFFINVSPDVFAFLPLDSNEVGLNTSKELQIQWSKDGIPQSMEEVTFITTRGVVLDSPNAAGGNTFLTVLTDTDGVAKVFVKADSSGFSSIRATSGDGSISAQTVVEFVSENPAILTVQASPTQLSVGDQSSIRAIARDADNNPVKNLEVNFSLSGAAGGLLNPASSITNSQGVASITFEATNTSGRDEVIVTAEAEGLSGSTTLTVGQRTLFFRFGTGNTIEVPSQSRFQKEFTVIVTDASGNPVANQELNVAVNPVNPELPSSPQLNEWAYRKGIWVPFPSLADFDIWVPVVSEDANDNEVICFNEDTNLNGILEPWEDFNNDGELTPGNVVVVDSITRSDSGGIAEFVISYPKDYAYWTQVEITVSDFAEGTENRSSRKFVLSYAGSYVTTKEAMPAANPFGSSMTCADTL